MISPLRECVESLSDFDLYQMASGARFLFEMLELSTRAYAVLFSRRVEQTIGAGVAGI